MLLNINWEFLDLTLKHQVVEALEVKMKGRCGGKLSAWRDRFQLLGHNWELWARDEK